MPPIVHSIEIDRPPDEVFSYVTDPARFVEWTMIQEITEINPPTSWAAYGVGGPIRPSANVTIEPLKHSTRSRVTFALDFKGHGIGMPLVPIIRRIAAKGAPKSYQNLKKRLENGD